MLGLANLDAHVALVLEVDLMMPRHLRTATLSILALVVLQIVILLDERPEVVALHIGGIRLAVDLALSKVPTVQLLARSRHVDEVARCGGVAVDIAAEDIGIAAVGIAAEVSVLIAVVDEAEARGGVLRLLEGVAGREEQTVRCHVGGIAELVVVDGIDGVTVVVIG